MVNNRLSQASKDATVRRALEWIQKLYQDALQTDVVSANRVDQLAFYSAMVVLYKQVPFRQEWLQEEVMSYLNKCVENAQTAILRQSESTMDRVLVFVRDSLAK